MAITRLYTGCKLPSPFVCAICGVKLTLDTATAGPLDSTRRQMFACVSHFSEVEKLINGWAEFFVAERRKQMEIELRNGGLVPGEGGSDVWTDT
jgi:hypothetical protein